MIIDYAGSKPWWFSPDMHVSPTNLCNTLADHISMQWSIFLDVWLTQTTYASIFGMINPQFCTNNLVGYTKLDQMPKLLKINLQLFLPIRNWSNLMQIETLGVDKDLKDWSRICSCIWHTCHRQDSNTRQHIQLYDQKSYEDWLKF